MPPARWTLLLGLALPFALRAEASDEYRVKAAFIYNLIKFVEWPPEAFPSAAAPVSICVLGRNLFGDALADAVRGKTIQGRTLTVKSVSDASEAGGCQVLFISSSERKRFPAILKAAPPDGVLTVGDNESFLSSGGIVNLRVEDDRVHLQINPDAAGRHRLRISSRLLSLAETGKEAR